MEKIRLALIGCGGRSYLAENAHNPACGVELAAVADPDPVTLKRYVAAFQQRNRYSPRAYTDYLAMIEQEKPDGALVITPDSAHETNACDLLARGVAVYLEKPLAISIDGCDRILECARMYRTKLMIGHNMRYMIFARKIRELIDTGAIGEVRAVWCRHFVNYGGDAYFSRWMSDRDRVNSLLLQKGAHDIDLIHWFGGAYTARAVGMGSLSVYDKLPRRPAGQPRDPLYGTDETIWPPERHHDLNPVIDVNDHNMVLLQLANGVQAVYTQCFYTPDSCRNYTVIGTRGRLENYGDFCTADSTVELWNQRHREAVFSLKGDVSYDTTARLELSHGGADAEIIGGFIRYLRDGVAPEITPQDSRYSVAAGCAGADSIRNHSLPVDIPPLSSELASWRF